MEKAGFKVSRWAEEILNKITFEKQKVNLVAKTVSELGFPNGGTLKEIYAKAKEQGLGLCPASVGPNLRLAYKDQPPNEYIVVAMEPVTVSDRHPGLLGLYRSDDGEWLDAWKGCSGDQWDREDVFVFLAPKVSNPLDSLKSDVLRSFELRISALERDIKKIKNLLN